ncbi:MAG: hypothetical protein GY745_21360 [Actinomycetia bacterium]|nr:hypothetical protein [Actinomycetes bacterium]MCP4087568.1 hypothetical protein [Actinomycetes bacterium]
MGLSTLLLAAAFGAGLCGGVAALWSRKPPSAFIVAGVLWLFGTFLISGSRGLDSGGVVHAVYLAAVVTLPVTAAISFFVERRRPDRRTLALTWLGLLALVPAAFGIYSTHIEPRWLAVDNEVIVTSTVSGPVRIGVLADVQTNRIRGYQTDTADRLVGQRPDLVVIPGDLYQFGDREAEFPERLQEFVEYVARFTSEGRTVVMVEGEHDDVEGLQEIAARTGAIVLADEVRELVIAGETLLVGGVRDSGDLSARQAVYTSLAAAPADVTTVLVTHRPEVAHEVDPATAPDLVIAGHTHGGQVALPVWGPIVPFTTLPRHMAQGGLWPTNGTQLYISTGVGLERGQAPQIRFLARPSVAVLDIVPG